MKIEISKFVPPNQRSNQRSNHVLQAGLLAVSALALLSVATPALAHHAMGSTMPSNFFEGLMSGIAHPLIGPDHFAFIVAVGLLEVTRTRGMLIPIAFVLAAMLGTGLHLVNLNVPGVELFVSGSIVLFGILLAKKDSLNTATVTGLSAVAGLFHGYAYGESIFGAEMTPLLAYLAGFTIIQLTVSLAAFWIGKATVLDRTNGDRPTFDRLRSAGLVIFGVGLAFFVSQVIGLLFPIAA
jgi:urease accessory protein